jgi:hypothetical protein
LGHHGQTLPGDIKRAADGKTGGGIRISGREPIGPSKPDGAPTLQKTPATMAPMKTKDAQIAAMFIREAQTSFELRLIQHLLSEPGGTLPKYGGSEKRVKQRHEPQITVTIIY